MATATVPGNRPTTCDDMKGLELDSPHLGKFARSAQEFAVSITSNAGGLINYGGRFRSGERVSSAMAESAVDAVVSKRFAKRQQMQWTRCGAPLLLQTQPAPSGPCSSAGIQGWRTTLPPVPVRQRRRECHTLPHAPLSAWLEAQPALSAVDALERLRGLYLSRFGVDHLQMVQRFMKLRRETMAHEVLLEPVLPTPGQTRGITGVDEPAPSGIPS